jgi:molecular chaperone Hsp33
VSWQAGGLMIQHLPEAGSQVEAQETDDDDRWAQAAALVGTVNDDELSDPQVVGETLLWRLFNETGVRVYEPVALRAACRCSRARMLDMLRGFSADDRAAMVGDNGRIGITCQFCSAFHDIDPADPALTDLADPALMSDREPIA